MKIGNLDISSFKVGGADCSIYLGDTLLYPTVKYKYQAKYTDDSEYKLECDTSTGLTSADTRVSSYTDVSAVTVGDCIQTLKTEVFSGFTSLANISLPNSLVNINARAFNGCRALTNIDIPSTVTYFGTGAFSGCTSLENINIPSGITSLPVNCFFNCYSLEEIEIPSGITTINGGVFSHCSGLTSCTIGSGVTSIGNSAFGDCSSLTSIDIPSSVSSISNYAFNGCSGLTSITVEATTPPTLGTYVFNYTSCPIYVPAASVDAYKTATNWSSYASRIFATPSESCIDDSSGTWVTVDGDFSTAQAVYKLDFASLRDAYLHGAPCKYASASINLYDENQNYIGVVDASYDEANDSFNVTVSSGSPSTVIYNEDVEEVDICSLFGKPLYLGYVEGEPPSYEYCVNAECLQYCCNEWDEESGECKDYDYDCCEETGECLQNEYIYLSSAFVENNNS